MSNPPKVYVTRRVPDSGFKPLRKKCDVTFWDSDDEIPRETLLKAVKDIDALFCLITEQIDAELLDAAGPNLKVVATMSVGTDHIDSKECRKRGVQVANTPDIASDSAADLTVALILMTTRRLVEGVDAVKSGQWTTWKPNWLLGTDMQMKTIGIFGFGRVGFGVARRLKPFGIKGIIYNDRSQIELAKDVQATFVSFDELLEQSDILCICCGLTGKTKNLFNIDVISKMKNTSVLINTSRGGVVVLKDLCTALENKKIFAAGLDVTEPEPLPSSDRLLNLKNCIVLPHMGTNTVEARNCMAKNTAKNILSLLGLDDSDSD